MAERKRTPGQQDLLSQKAGVSKEKIRGEIDIKTGIRYRKMLISVPYLLKIATQSAKSFVK